LKTLSIHIVLLLILSCSSQENNTKDMTSSEHKHTNRLIESSSPYLLQHAHNPVDWYPWGKEALEKAKNEDKPIIVSIGYAACHWCHVMERESFENDSIASIMNEHFVCIKVDREERPDVDQVYMDAVQAMGLNGGWPLNVFITPDQKPFYGGTYFPPEQWTQILQSIAKAFKENREKLEKSAEKFTQTLSASEIEKYGLTPTENPFEKKLLDDMFTTMSQRFDKKNGGMGEAPKFPMPSNWTFLLRYYKATKNELALQQINKTLENIGYGGIYDQVGGGFARYSVDAEWFAPHFEKMLYDNAQLVSVYSEAYLLTKNPYYKTIVEETINWLQKEMMSDENGFYSSLDADSEGEEGKYYVWKYNDFEKVLGSDAPVMAAYYNVTTKGNWEHGNNILHRDESNAVFSEKENISQDDLAEIILKSKSKLYKAREKRVRPGLDDKILLGWNAVMAKGLIDAYNAFSEKQYLELALKNIQFIEENMREGNNLFRNYKSGKASIPAYLEDYALYIDALNALYQSTFDEQYLEIADQLLQYVISNFYDQKEGLFFYTNNDSEDLIARKKEIFDNVIPSSNSIMAINLHVLGTILDKKEYHDLSDKMLSQIAGIITSNTGHLSNWATLYSYKVQSTPEIVIIGENADEIRASITAHYIPNKVLLGNIENTESSLPLMDGKYAIDGKTTIYVCFNKTCKLPVFEVEDALKLIKGNF